MIEGVPITYWCSLFCSGQEAVGDMEIEFKGDVISLPLCQDCANTLENNPALAIDLMPTDVL